MSADYIHCPVEEQHHTMESCGCGYKATLRAFPGEEPAAELRTFAGALRGMYVALQQEGFSAQEALIVIGQWLAAIQPGGGK